MLQNARVTVFNVSELLRENQQVKVKPSISDSITMFLKNCDTVYLFTINRQELEIPFIPEKESKKLFLVQFIKHMQQFLQTTLY